MCICLIILVARLPREELATSLYSINYEFDESLNSYAPGFNIPCNVFVNSIWVHLSVENGST